MIEQKSRHHSLTTLHSHSSLSLAEYEISKQSSKLTSKLVPLSKPAKPAMAQKRCNSSPAALPNSSPNICDCCLLPIPAKRKHNLLTHGGMLRLWDRALCTLPPCLLGLLLLLLLRRLLQPRSHPLLDLSPIFAQCCPLLCDSGRQRQGHEGLHLVLKPKQLCEYLDGDSTQAKLPASKQASERAK
jgi:hypothetical protein